MVDVEDSLMKLFHGDSIVARKGSHAMIVGSGKLRSALKGLLYASRHCSPFSTEDLKLELGLQHQVVRHANVRLTTEPRNMHDNFVQQCSSFAGSVLYLPVFRDMEAARKTYSKGISISADDQLAPGLSRLADFET